MAVIIELTVDAADFDLGQVTAYGEKVAIELERVVPTGGEVMPFFWVSGIDFDEFEQTVRARELVEDLTPIAHIGDRVLYHVSWGSSVSSLTRILIESESTILEATGTTPWMFRLRFSDHTNVRKFYSQCQDSGIDIHVNRVYTLTDEDTNVYQFNITSHQHEALVAAISEGYFKVPRGTTLREVADQLEISPQAASERVRRGADKVLRSVLLSGSAMHYSD
ncbi:helix-turn-helix domain-containing protein [Haloferax namakaokahaiae]|uniref:Helix-turn-helix domain-containing protein n=1 Tax=Haloferax namakaokahaiae TaxID=1748331 RepID=A0ABD5ZC76_9EURY